MRAQVFVAEAIQSMFATQNGGKELAIGGDHGLEAGITLSLFCMGLAQAIQCRDGFAYGLSVRQRFQVTRIRQIADLRIPPEGIFSIIRGRARRWTTTSPG